MHEIDQANQVSEPPSLASLVCGVCDVREQKTDMLPHLCKLLNT